MSDQDLEDDTVDGEAIDVYALTVADMVKPYVFVLLVTYGMVLCGGLLAWGVYAAGIDLHTLGYPLFGSSAGLMGDCLCILGVSVAVFMAFGDRIKANAKKINAPFAAPPLSRPALSALALHSLFTGVLGFGVMMALFYAFLPHSFGTLSSTFELITFNIPVDLPEGQKRAALFLAKLPLSLLIGGVFGAFMGATSMEHKGVKYGTWAVFLILLGFGFWWVRGY